MKRLITIFLVLVSQILTGQVLERQTIIDTTRADGQRFIVTMPYFCRVELTDSVTVTADSSFTQEGYISLANSYAVYNVRKVRIIGTDTLVRDANIEIPLNVIGNSVDNFLMGSSVRKEVRKEAKKWLNRKLSQEF